jgi:hypothetical protein
MFQQSIQSFLQQWFKNPFNNFYKKRRDEPEPIVEPLVVGAPLTEFNF